MSINQDQRDPTLKAQVDDPGNPAAGGVQQMLDKLQVLGPALWLYARDANRKFNFLADMDWLVLPPVMLGQYRLYTRKRIPYAFFTWARVSEAVDERLQSGVARLAPQEWHCGPHVWLTDAVTPFGCAEAMIEELLKEEFSGCRVRALHPNPVGDGTLAVCELREGFAQ